MFKIIKDHTVMWPVTINVPKDSTSRGGESDQRKVVVQFKVLPRDQADKLFASDDNTVENDWLAGVWIGWKDGDFQNEDGTPLPFNEENRRMLLAIPSVRTAVQLAYYEASLGGGGRRKNS